MIVATPLGTVLWDRPSSAQEDKDKKEEALPESEVLSLWPQPPEFNLIHGFLIAQPHLEAFEGDSFHMVEQEEAFPGQLVYSYAAHGRGIVFRSIGRLRRLENQQSAVASYRISGSNNFAPNWHPKYHDIYFSHGDPWYPGSGSTMLRWDFLSKKTSPFAGMQIPQVNWSPSAELITYFKSSQGYTGDLESYLVINNVTLRQLNDIHPYTADDRVSWSSKDTMLFPPCPMFGLRPKVRRGKSGPKDKKIQNRKNPIREGQSPGGLRRRHPNSEQSKGNWPRFWPARKRRTKRLSIPIWGHLSQDGRTFMN